MWEPSDKLHSHQATKPHSPYLGQERGAAAQAVSGGAGGLQAGSAPWERKLGLQLHGYRQKRGVGVRHKWTHLVLMGEGFTAGPGDMPWEDKPSQRAEETAMTMVCWGLGFLSWDIELSSCISIWWTRGTKEIQCGKHPLVCNTVHNRAAFKEQWGLSDVPREHKAPDHVVALS